MGWVDHPDTDRKLHAAPIPRVGGVAIVVAYLASYGLLAAVHLNGWRTTQLDLDLVLSVVPGVALVFLMGILDDKRGIRPVIKLFMQTTAAVIAYAGGLHVTVLSWIPVEKWWWSLPLTVFWLVLCTNAFNLIDGMDGLSSGLGLFATVTLICVASLNNNYGLLLATVPLAAALLGFLPYNSNPASIFLGDCGSYSLGFLLGCFGIVWSHKSATLLSLAAPLLCFAVPLLDLTLAILRRILGAKSIFSADRLHIHHRLLDRGLNPRRAVFVLYGAAAIAAGLSMMSSLLRDAYAGWIILPFVCATWIGVRNLRYAVFKSVDPVTFVEKAWKVMQAEKIVQTARNELDTARSHDARWEVITTAAGQLGFLHVGMTIDGSNFHKSFHGSDETPAWVVAIPLTGGGSVELAHRFDKQELAAASLASLADALRTGFATSQRRYSVMGNPVRNINTISHPLRKAVS
jgi:UDP-GlcNAc:undecaprenyl-phosphate GlcNAc-1-phosphate transferase